MSVVREFEKAGCAALHLEDQVSPKRCGHMAGKSCIPAEEMVQKVKAAVDARRYRPCRLVRDAGAARMGVHDDCRGALAGAH